jgi:type IV pilus assembly protein PilC
MIVIPLLIVIAIQLLKLRESTRYFWDLVKIRLPILKLLLYNRLLALLAEQLRLLISAGITIDRAFDVAADVIGNEVFKKAIIQIKRDVMAGVKISEAMASTTMVSIGEVSGNLDQQFGFLAQHYYKIVDNISENIGKMIEPILMITLGLMMGVMIAGVLLPMYDVFSKIK